MYKKSRLSVGRMFSTKWPKLMDRLIRRDLLFFMHIPKTAGTSFRYGAEQFFGKPRVDYDYGGDSLVTSESVRKYFYDNLPDPWMYFETSGRQKTRMVCGHVHIGKFVPLAGISRTLTFVRDPCQRVASEYAHIVRNKNYEGSFRDFYTKPFMKNTMSRYFGTVDVEAVGFIGLSERYSECLAVINELYGLDIPLLEENCGRAEQADLHEISAEEEEELRRINQIDIALYQYCTELLDARLQMMRKDLPFAHARMTLDGAKAVRGWAWWGDGNDAPVEVEIYLNGVIKDKVLATDFCQNLSYLRSPRRGYVGFNLPVKLEDGDEVQCVVAKTSQVFPLKPTVVKLA
jgi:hypothetical protein